jgi:flagellar basal-body rod modification protein FlgD
MAVSAVNSTPNAAAAYAASNTGSTPMPKTLGIDDFLKLLTTQLSYQDPMKPMEDTQFISQMANFTSLETMRSLQKDFATFQSDQKMGSAQDFLGKTVTIGAGTTAVTGLVTEISLEDSEPKLVINGQSYDPAEVSSIKTTAAAAKAATAVGTAPTTPP